MKNLLTGLTLGVIIAIVVWLLATPKLKQVAYDQGFAEGRQTGIAAGTLAGIEVGHAKCIAEQARTKDSITAARLNAARKKSARKPVEEAKPVQNWHVIDGRIAEPVGQ
jgi:hypothetical protein